MKSILLFPKLLLYIYIFLIIGPYEINFIVSPKIFCNFFFYRFLDSFFFPFLNSALLVKLNVSNEKAVSN